MGDAEVRDLDPAVVGQQDVRRLDVLVDHAVLVRVLECRQQLLHDGADLFLVVAAPLEQPLVQRLAGHEFHRDEGDFLAFAVVVYLHDARMHQSSGSLCLALESFEDAHRLVGLERALDQRLDGDWPLDRRIEGRIHGTHATPAEDAVHFEFADGGG